MRLRVGMGAGSGALPFCVRWVTVAGTEPRGAPWARPMLLPLRSHPHTELLARPAAQWLLYLQKKHSCPRAHSAARGSRGKALRGLLHLLADIRQVPVLPGALGGPGGVG